jgi:DNA-binding transcriptional LysR family regulator
MSEAASYWKLISAISEIKDAYHGCDMTRIVNLDLDLVRAFLTVAETRSFTRAGERLGRTQAAVSLQIRRLEDRLGVRLLDRDPRRVALSLEGEAFLPQARRLIRINDEIVAGLDDADVEGEVRFGAPEDVATTYLPEILAAFARSHPRVSLEIVCDFTLNLQDRFAQGLLDLALIKREPLGPDAGVRVWREPLVWAAADAGVAERDGKLILAVAPPPDVYRRRALTALDDAGRPWRIGYVSPSLAGLHAALRAGLGVTVLARDMVPDDLVVLGTETGLPALPDAEIALISARASLPAAARLLREHVLAALDRQRHPHIAA